MEEDENCSQQVSELQSLESIYPEELKVLVADKELMINVSVDITNKDGLTVLLQSTGAASTLIRTNSLPSAIPGVATVTHLPPVTLYVRYTPLYPSSEPPFCHLSARWLNPGYTDRLTEKLKGMFTPGWPVVFEWISYISASLLDDYCQLLNDTRVLEEPHPQQEPHPHQEPNPQQEPHPQQESHPCQIFVRTISELNDVEQFDQFECHKEFLSTLHECSICLGEMRGEECIEPCEGCGQGAGSVYCRPCVTEYCLALIKEGRVTKITCPSSSCDIPLGDELITQLLDKQSFDKYLKFRDQIQFESLPGLVYCPRAACNAMVTSDPASQLAVCDSCGFPFCKECRQTWHGVERCTVFDKLSETPSDDETVSAAAADNSQDKTKTEELKSILWMRSRDDIHQCPKCTAAIQKTGGCNLMTCWRCGSGFCWLCNKLISGYEHFGRGGSNCELMKGEKQQSAVVDVDTLADEEASLDRLLRSSCPRCSKVHEKTTRNNWIHCAHCNMKYCHMCEEPCYGVYHFSEYSCKRHSTVQEDLDYMKRNGLMK